MEEIKCEQVGMLSGDSWDKCHETNRRVYSSNGLSPTITTMGGGQREPKIIEPICLNSKVDGNLVLNRDIACAKTTREGSTRADASDYISPDFLENANIAGIDLQQYRIRKLTERECFRLMGVKQEDFERVAKNQSTSSLYHLAGDSIVTTCLMAIFGELFGVDYNEKINSLTEELRK